MEQINSIVIHCTKTPPAQNIGLEELYRLHRKQGMLDVSYHYIIKIDGSLQKGRQDNTQGAHTQGHNKDSLAICLVGGVNSRGKPEDTYTLAQYVTLASVVQVLTCQHPAAEVLGHQDYPNCNTACPSFDVRTWYAETINIH